MRNTQKRINYNKTNQELRQEGIVLLQNGIKAYKIATNSLDSYYGEKDSSSKNWGCYMLQQCIELILKGLIKYYYEYFREGHYVRYNAKFLVDLSENYRELSEISEELTILQSDINATLYRWEAISRYNTIYATYQSIIQIDNIASNLVTFIYKHKYLE